MASSGAAELRLRQQSLPQRKPDMLDIRTDAKFALDKIAEIGDRLRADVKRIGDLLRRPLGEQHAQHLKFPRSQNVGGDGLASKAAERKFMVDVRTDRDLSIEDVDHSPNECLRWTRLGDVPSRSGPDCL